MTTSVEVFALTATCGNPLATGVTVENGDTLTVQCNVADTWDMGVGQADRICNADGATKFPAFLLACDGLTELYGTLCGKLGVAYFLIGTNYSKVISGLSGIQQLYLYVHDTPTSDNAGSITAAITVTKKRPSNALMFSCNT
jgi:hypothetical protein